ncbi:MAG TPA: hypothetical protein VG096_04775 [Bryobacteraceae bacterium]|jgi:hypothetical protein|nr:hypothetical protein [Bryobacteraceae bacterium]
MPVTWEIRDQILVIIIVGYGGEEPRAVLLEAIASPQFRPGMSVLFDVRLSTDNSTSDELRSRAQWLSTLQAEGISSRCAIVVGPKAYQYGLARMAAAHVEFQGMTLEIFQDIYEAKRWLSNTAGQDRLVTD